MGKSKKLNPVVIIIAIVLGIFAFSQGGQFQGAIVDDSISLIRSQCGTSNTPADARIYSCDFGQEFQFCIDTFSSSCETWVKQNFGEAVWQNCEWFESCEADSCSDPPSEHGRYLCKNTNKVFKCDDGTWDPIGKCPSGEQCKVELTTSTSIDLVCSEIEPICTDADNSCDGNILTYCFFGQEFKIWNCESDGLICGDSNGINWCKSPDEPAEQPTTCNFGGIEVNPGQSICSASGTQTGICRANSLIVFWGPPLGKQCTNGSECTPGELDPTCCPTFCTNGCNDDGGCIQSQAGAGCKGEADCTAGHFCNDASKCEKVQCLKDSECNDNNICTKDVCVSQVDCVFEPISDGKICKTDNDEVGKCELGKCRLEDKPDTTTVTKVDSECLTGDDCASKGKCVANDAGTKCISECAFFQKWDKTEFVAGESDSGCVANTTFFVIAGVVLFAFAFAKKL